MNKFILTIISVLITVSITAQNYWQQEVNYKITVRLDDKNHSLMAYEEFEYINNSPDKLDRLYIHLWPNAYRNGKTALGRQQYEGGETELTFGEEKNRGSIDSLDFKVSDQKVKWEYDPQNIDIAILYLNTPLGPGERIKVSTPFYVKIPSGSISRLGHIDQSYQITQWYPKPAVYDKKGWNPIPYLNQGEFYSEYGSFDVTITLPKNYVVGATGDLQTEEEIDFLNAKSQETLKRRSEYLMQKQGRFGKTPFPESDPEFKTIRYTQSQVHDFAWFADKRYAVSKGEVTLPHSKRKVTTWAMWVPHNTITWQHADEYLKDGTYYYSLWNGDYPYNQVTAVDGTISAGGGMEYPNITVIGNASSKEDLEVVIVHEVGHNWFYGILGSNERVHGWMDEGLNTLNEVRYIQTKYPDNTRMSEMVFNGRFHLNDLDHHDMGDISYRMLAILGEDQPIETHSADFTSANYGVVMYQKTGLVFYYLKDYLGEELFDKCMRAYFDEWKFRHPQPEDIETTLERVSGKDLDWLFKDLIQTTNHVDYKICRVKKADDQTTVTVRNVGQVNGPIEVNLMSKGEVVATEWAEPGDRKRALSFKSDISFDEVRIDESKDIPEIWRSNNSWRAKGLFGKVEPLKMEFLIGDNETDKTNLFWTPVIAGNYYDKVMLGAAIHNNAIPFNRFQYLIAPMYSFGRKSISGLGEFSYTLLPKKLIKNARIGVSVKSFNSNSMTGFTEEITPYFVYSPYFFAKLGNRTKSPFAHSLLIQMTSRSDLNVDANTFELDQYRWRYNGYVVNYGMDYTRSDHRISSDLRYEFVNSQYVTMERLMLEGNYSFRYLKKSMKRWIELRAFAGTYLNFETAYDAATTYTYPFAMSLSGTDGSQDLFFQNYFFGRGRVDGLWSQQRDENMGGFKSTAQFGTTTDWMLTGNLYVQLPVPKLNIFGAFADYGLFSNGISTSAAINTGLALRLGKVFGLYFPLWMSQELSDSFGNSSYAEKIRFTLKLNPVNGGLNLRNLF
jgi:hypothetical protein